MNTNPTIKVKRSLVQGKIPTTGQLGLGELAINHYDGKLFIRQDTLGVGIGTTVISLSNVGPQGAQGLIGPQGAQGAQGATGAQGASASSNYTVKTTTYTAVSGDRILADTSGGAWTLTLPATPSSGDIVSLADAASWSTNNLTVARNGSTIEGIVDNFVLDIAGIQVDLIYDGTTWEIYANVGQQGVQGPQGAQGATGPVAGSANQVVYKDSSNAAAGSDTFVFTGTNVGIGSTIPGATLQVTPTSTAIAGLFSGTTSSDMVRITQLGTGNALVVEDETNPDATPFVVNASGNLGIGITNPITRFQVGAATSQSVFITSTGLVGLGSTAPRVSLDASQETDAIALPQGTTAQRPSGNSPYIRYNTTNSALEFYNGTDWVEIISDYFPTGSVILG